MRLRTIYLHRADKKNKAQRGRVNARELVLEPKTWLLPHIPIAKFRRVCRWYLDLRLYQQSNRCLLSTLNEWGLEIASIQDMCQSLWNFINPSRVLQASPWYKLVVFPSGFFCTLCKPCNSSYCTVKFTFVFLCLRSIPILHSTTSHTQTHTLKEKGRKRGVRRNKRKKDGGRIDEKIHWPSNKLMYE